MHAFPTYGWSSLIHASSQSPRNRCPHQAANRASRASYVSLLLLSLSLTIVRTIARGLPARLAELIRVFCWVPRNTADETFKSNISLVSLRLSSPRLVSPREIDAAVKVDRERLVALKLALIFEWASWREGAKKRSTFGKSPSLAIATFATYPKNDPWITGKISHVCRWNARNFAFESRHEIYICDFRARGQTEVKSHFSHVSQAFELLLLTKIACCCDFTAK